MRATRWGIGVLVAATLTLVAPTAAAAAVSVEARLVRLLPGGAVVTGRVVWDATAARADRMSVGDLRLVAVSEHGHRPTLLATDTYQEIAATPTQRVRLLIQRGDLDAIRRGNRVVLTASQHGVVSRTRTTRTFVTVGELQPFGTPQDRIGRRDCSDVPIVQGADLNNCDLVGAFLNGALVSDRKSATRMLLADLTGATMVGANLTGLSVAGGRLNGADITDADIDNLFLGGAEATKLVAHNAMSRDAMQGANMFDARLTDADFSDAVLNGVSLTHARLDGADFEGASWDDVKAGTASFRGADLRGLKKSAGSVYFADFTGANLQGTAFTEIDLAWATLCHTVLPSGFPPGDSNRDCRAPTDPGPTPAANPYVVVDATLQRQQGGAEIHATIQWNADGIKSGMSAGNLRAVAIDGSTGVPTTVGKKDISQLPSAPTSYEFAITDPEQLAALNPGNRVVLTATQHPPLPRRTSDKTHSSYVTVRTLQPGPGRGRVGSRDCSDLTLSDTTPAPGGYDFCDLPGAVLKQAGLSGPMREADLTGADLRDAGLKRMVFDGAAMGGANAEGADFTQVSLTAAFAPRLTIPETHISDSELRAISLDDADFKGATISESSFATASLRRATFTGATLIHEDLAFARLQGAKLDHVHAKIQPTLQFANLTGATLEGFDSDWGDDEDHQRPWEWATLCHTIMPAGAAASGDRDCPR